VGSVVENKRGLAYHIATKNISRKLSSSLPAIHAFSRCDSTKIGTKRQIYRMANISEHILDTSRLLEKPTLSSKECDQFETFFEVNKEKG